MPEQERGPSTVYQHEGIGRKQKTKDEEGGRKKERTTRKEPPASRPTKSRQQPTRDGQAVLQTKEIPACHENMHCPFPFGFHSEAWQKVYVEIKPENWQERP